MKTLTSVCFLLCIGVVFSASLLGRELLKNVQNKPALAPAGETVAFPEETLEGQETQWGWGGHGGHHHHHSHGGYGGYGGDGGWGGGYGGWGGGYGDGYGGGYGGGWGGDNGWGR